MDCIGTGSQFMLLSEKFVKGGFALVLRTFLLKWIACGRKVTPSKANGKGRFQPPPSKPSPATLGNSCLCVL